MEVFLYNWKFLFVQMEVFSVQMKVFFTIARCPRVFWKHGIPMEGMMKVLVKVIVKDKDCREIFSLTLNEFKQIN